MNRWSIILLMLSHCSCELVIKSNKSVIGIVGKPISLKWEMKNDGIIFGPMVYINNWKNKNLIITNTGARTDEGEKLFGNRISRIWNTKPAYYYELTIKNLSYSDAHIIQMKVVYEDKNSVYKTDNTSSINLEVKGGVDVCGNQLEDAIEYGDDISQTFHLCGNPKPKVSYEINDGETHMVPGTVVDEKTKKYRYTVNLTMKPFYCGKTIKHQFTGWENRAHEVKLIPKRVNVVRYELNATNCTTVEWEKVNYGTCYSDLKYNLTFITHDGSIYQRVTHMTNQTTFVDCQDTNLQHAHSVTVRAVHKDYTGKPSRNVTRRDPQDHSGTTTPTVPNTGISGKLNRILLIISVPIVLVIVLVIVYYICKFKKTPSKGEEVEQLNGENLDEEKKVPQMENETPGKINAKIPKSPSLDEDSPFFHMQHPTYAQYEPTVRSKQSSTRPPVYSSVKSYHGSSSTKEGLYAPVNESENDPKKHTYTKPYLDYSTIPGESDKEVPQRQLETDNGETLKSYDPNGQKDDIKHSPSNPGFFSEYDTVIDPPIKEVPTYAVVDKSSKQLGRQEDLIDAYPTNSSSSQPLLPNAPQTKDDYEEVTSVVPGKSYHRKENKGTSRSDYDEIDQYAQL